jgi:ribosomal protein L4
VLNKIFIDECTIFVIKINKMDAITIKVYPDDKEQTKAIKSILKAFKIKFKVEEEKSYNPEFVERILLAKEEIKKGKGVKIATKDLWK